MQSLRQPASAGARAHRATARARACRVRASATAVKSVSGTMKRLKDEKK
jgi:hypothetical protein